MKLKVKSDLLFFIDKVYFLISSQIEQRVDVSLLNPNNCSSLCFITLKNKQVYENANIATS